MEILAVSDIATLLLAEGILGSPETTKTEALAEYAQKAGMGLTSAQVAQVVPAAHHRRLGLYRIAPGTEVLVHFGREATSIPRREEPAPGDKDLLAQVTLRTKSKQRQRPRVRAGSSARPRFTGRLVPPLRPSPK